MTTLPKVEIWGDLPNKAKIVRMVIHRANLNPRQERFVLECLKDGNGTRAAIRAGYAASSAAVPDAQKLIEVAIA